MKKLNKKLRMISWYAPRQRPWQLLKLAEREWKQRKKAQQRTKSECGRSTTYEMRRKLDLQFPSECCCGKIGAVSFINGVNASVTLLHPLTSSKYWLSPSLCYLEFLIILIFSERLTLTYWNALPLWLVESCSVKRDLLWGGEMLSDASQVLKISTYTLSEGKEGVALAAASVHYLCVYRMTVGHQCFGSTHSPTHNHCSYSRKIQENILT